mmetsp:Transcript_50299/g.126249  ORF Transcript_50299/g.126249 Transcript_50299/m.126249 type:complete len:134 (-) Transcript_50299:491-892(-)
MNKAAVSDIATVGAEAFVNDVYYKLYDSNRKDLIRLYHDTSVMIWNGIATKGKEPLLLFLEKLPPTQHTILSFDAQPIVCPTNPSTLAALLVVVQGTVLLDNLETRDFHQSITLVQDEAAGSYYISVDVLRLV